ncbi:MAG: hypothetical protein U0572_08465 [Phycisphaerales bacterium]
MIGAVRDKEKIAAPPNRAGGSGEKYEKSSGIWNAAKKAVIGTPGASRLTPTEPRR